MSSLSDDNLNSRLGFICSLVLGGSLTISWLVLLLIHIRRRTTSVRQEIKSIQVAVTGYLSRRVVPSVLRAALLAGEVPATVHTILGHSHRYYPNTYPGSAPKFVVTSAGQNHRQQSQSQPCPIPPPQFVNPQDLLLPKKLEGLRDTSAVQLRNIDSDPEAADKSIASGLCNCQDISKHLHPINPASPDTSEHNYTNTIILDALVDVDVDWSFSPESNFDSGFDFHSTTETSKINLEIKINAPSNTSSLSETPSTTESHTPRSSPQTNSFLDTCLIFYDSQEPNPSSDAAFAIDNTPPSLTSSLTPISSPTSTTSAEVPLPLIICEFSSCSRTFTHRHVYNRHKRSHTHPSLCYICNRGFETVKDVNRHINDKHHTTKVWLCEAEGCNYSRLGGRNGKWKGFTRKENLARHLKRHSIGSRGRSA